MYLWKISLRRISNSPGKKEFWWHVATEKSSEVDAYNLVLKHYTPEWLFTVTDIELMGELVGVEGLELPVRP